MLDYILNNFLVIYLLEIGAAISGCIYLNRVGDPPIITKIFVYYLWFMVGVEILGLYPTYAYFSNYTYLSFIKDTPFERNYWLYNCYQIISFMVYLSFFIFQLESGKLRKIFGILVGIFTLSSVINLIFSGVFFIKHASYTIVFGTILLVIVIFIYYYELLKSNRILNFYHNPAFYISVGALVWHLIVTPLFIYNSYFSLQSPDFIRLHSWILRLANGILYGLIITGFLFSYNKEKRKLQKV